MAYACIQLVGVFFNLGRLIRGISLSILLASLLVDCAFNEHASTQVPTTTRSICTDGCSIGTIEQRRSLQLHQPHGCHRGLVCSNGLTSSSRYPPFHVVQGTIHNYGRT